MMALNTSCSILELKEECRSYAKIRLAMLVAPYWNFKIKNGNTASTNKFMTVVLDCVPHWNLKFRLPHLFFTCHLHFSRTTLDF